MSGRKFAFLAVTYLLLQSIYLGSGGKERYLRPPADSLFQNVISADVTVVCQGTVYKIIRRSDYQMLYLKENSIRYNQKNYEENRILVYDDSFTDIHIGNVLTVSGQASQFEEAHNPGNFDMRFYYAKQHLYGSIWSRTLNVADDTRKVWQDLLCTIRDRWKTELLYQAGEKNGGILCAMLTGDKDELPEDVLSMYQTNGISHILAISGLHISFLGWNLYRILRKTGAGIGVSSLVSAGILLSYLIMIGSPTSAVRAAVMLLVRMGADLCGRDYDMLNGLLLSAVLHVGAEPLILADAGFLMSYGAILGILFVRPVLEKWTRKESALHSGWLSSLSVQIFLIPMLLYFYYEISVYGIFFNLLVIPLMPAILSLGVAGSLAGVMSYTMGTAIFALCDFILKLIEWMGNLLLRLPFASVCLGRPAFFWIVSYYLCLCLFLLYGGMEKREKKIRLLRYGGLLLGGFLMLQGQKERTENSLEVTFMDVGQGEGIFIKGPNRGTYMVDGGSSDVSDVAKYRIVPYLNSRGITQIDYAFVTHGDADHYSGIREILAHTAGNLRICRLILPVGYEQQEELVSLKNLAERKSVAVYCMRQGMKIEENGFSISYIQPVSEEENTDKNAGSMILSLTYKKTDILLTGDVEGEGEKLLEKRLSRKTYEVVKASHHGSKNANKEDLLGKIRPQVVIVSAGRNNDYGHPHEETIQRFLKWTNQIYNTAVSGAITVKTDGKSVFLSSYH